MDIEHISVSRLQTFETCHAKYYYQYHLKLPIEDEPYYFAYGSTIHLIAQLWVESGDPEALPVIAKRVLDGEIELSPGEVAPPLQGEYIKKFPVHLQNLQKIAGYIGWKDKTLTEYGFRYDLDPPNGHFVKGFIDRIVFRPNGVFVIDYKTTKRGRFRKNQATIVEDLQLRTYAKVIQRDFGAKATEIFPALYYLEDDELVGVKFSQKSLDAAEQTLRDAYRQISSLGPHEVAGRVGDHCANCPFRKNCQWYALT